MRAAFADISVPLIPLEFYVRAQYDPEKIKNNVFIFIFLF